MNTYRFTIAGSILHACASGALWWPDQKLLCVSDLHLGKSARMARRGGALLPPYEGQETLTRLDADLARYAPRKVICLGDSFDDAEAAVGLEETLRLWILRLMEGRDWTWIEGNHDPGPISLGGTYLGQETIQGITFRHIAVDDKTSEISGHYHPKFKLSGKTRPCFLIGTERVILPAYGTYTGGMASDAAPFARLIGKEGRAVLTGHPFVCVPLR